MKTIKVKRCSVASHEYETLKDKKVQLFIFPESASTAIQLRYKLKRNETDRIIITGSRSNMAK